MTILQSVLCLFLLIFVENPTKSEIVKEKTHTYQTEENGIQTQTEAKLSSKFSNLRERRNTFEDGQLNERLKRGKKSKAKEKKMNRVKVVPKSDKRKKTSRTRLLKKKLEVEKKKKSIRNKRKGKKAKNEKKKKRKAVNRLLKKKMRANKRTRKSYKKNHKNIGNQKKIKTPTSEKHRTFCKSQTEYIKVGVLLKQFGDLRRRVKNQVNNGIEFLKSKKNSTKTKVFKDAADKIKNATIYPYAPKCTKTITEIESNEITDTYNALLACPDTIEKACPHNGINLKRNNDTGCTDTNFESLVQILLTCLRQNNCNDINTEELTTLQKECTEIVDPEKEHVSKIKPQCKKEFKRCKNLEVKAAHVLESCLSGKPEYKEPKKAQIFEVRRYSQKRGNSDILVKEMDIEEHGLYFFTQVTTYDPALKLLKIDVPSHGFNLDKIDASTTYLLQTGTDDTIFDKEIKIASGKSNIMNVSIEIKPIVDVLENKKSRENFRNKNIESNHFENIVSSSEKVDKSSLHPIIQQLTKDTEVFEIKKTPISESIRKMISLGAKYFTNVTKNSESEHTESPMITTKNPMFRKQFKLLRQKRQDTRTHAQPSQDCTMSMETAFLAPDPNNPSHCTYILKIGGSEYTVSNHEIVTESRFLSCCNDQKKFPWPSSCYCSYLYQPSQPYHTEEEFQNCFEYKTTHTSTDCCRTVKKDNVDYYLAGLAGIAKFAYTEHFGCQDHCLYSDGTSYRCFKPSDGVTTYCGSG